MTTETYQELLAEKKRQLINLTVAVFSGQTDGDKPKVTEADVCTMLLKVEERHRLRVLEQEIYSAWVGAVCAFSGPAAGFDRPPGLELPDVAYCYMQAFDGVQDAGEVRLKGGKRIYEELLKGEFPSYWQDKLNEAGVSLAETATVFAESMELPSDAGKDEDEQKDDSFFWTCAQCKSHRWYDDPVACIKFCSDCGYELTTPEVQQIAEAVAKAEGLSRKSTQRPQEPREPAADVPEASDPTQESREDLEASEGPSRASGGVSLEVVEVKPGDPIPVWTSSDGTVTPVPEMSDMHLVNSFRQLRRKGERNEWEQSDEALYTAMSNEVVDRGLQAPAAEGRMLLSPAKLSMAIRCGEQYRFRYEEGLKIPPSGAMIVGSSVGKSAEKNLRWKASEGRTLELEEVLDIATSEFARRWDNSEVQLDDNEASKPKKAVRGSYLDATVKTAQVHAEKFAPTIDVVDVESEFVISPSGRDWSLYGYKDVKTPDGIRELKTSGRLKSQKDADSDLQMTSYGLDERANQGLAKPRLVMDTINRKNGKFAKLETQRSDEDYKSFLSMTDLLVEAIKRGTLPPARFKPGWWPCSEKYCGYWSRCRFGARFGRKVD